MSWTIGKDEHLDPLFEFVVPREAFSTAFSSRMFRKGKFQLPKKSDAAVFIKMDRGRITGSIMITSGGLLLPLFSRELYTDFSFPLLEITEYKRQIYCILGNEPDVRRIVDFFPAPRNISLYYYLMEKRFALKPLSLSDTGMIGGSTSGRFKESSHRRKNPGDPEIPVRINDITIRRATAGDAKAVFPLEKAYLFEEVLIHPDRFNASAAYTNFLLACRQHTVFVAFNKKEPVAKVATNAEGIHYSQIGGVYTHPSRRREGLSRILMKHLLDTIDKNEKNSVLFVKTENLPAIRLYENLDFKTIGNYRITYLN